MRTRVIEVLIAALAMTCVIRGSALAAQEQAAPGLNMGGDTTSTATAPAPPPGWLKRDTLTGDWGGARP